MSVLRTIKCPHCGKTHLLGRPCPCGGPEKAERSQPSAGPRLVAVVLTFLGTAASLTAIALAVANAKSTAAGMAIVIGAWILLHLCRLGYDWEDGIDVRQLLFPGPWDWPVKMESFLNLWTSPRAFFRATYLGAIVALIITSIVLIGP